MVYFLLDFFAISPLLSAVVLVITTFISMASIALILLSPFVQQYSLIERSLTAKVSQMGNEEEHDYALVDKVRDKLSGFNLAGGEINNCASHLAINAAEVAYFLQELYESIQESSQDADKIAIAARDMSATTEEVNKSATVASEQSNEAMKASNEGSAEIALCHPIVEKLDKGVKEGAERIQLLSDKAAEIQNITDVINSIAQQTNLLALNAAIEAARAGDQGRGFAVVADEVRALAARTSDATSQIDGMLKVINEESQNATSLMSVISSQSEQVVESVASLSSSFQNINRLISESTVAASQISVALTEQDKTTSEISSSINNISEFLRTEIDTTKSISNQALGLSAGAESIFVSLKDFDTQSAIDTMSEQAQSTAEQIGKLFEQEIKAGNISSRALFDYNYSEIADTNPPKFSTSFDKFTDSVLPGIQEPLLEKYSAMIYAGAVDINGYFPTHNKIFSQPLTGEYVHDVNHNRTKRIFDDPTGIRCGKHTQPFLLQTYKRDTGEVMHDVSAPIMVNGKHWGGFRIGFKAQTS
ncbi:MAG: methyl-accepting chemotaxis protein [Oceanospirillaceae bacterium]|nr:methyl-accepting chemotaxis protein [Oceanospirillaceae bacterium]